MMKTASFQGAMPTKGKYSVSEMFKNALDGYSACHVVPCHRVLLTILCSITL
jgi:hypothetical protein